MRLTVFNGSPRGEGSNTKILLEHFINGFMTTEGNIYELAYLSRVKESDNFVKLFREAEHVLLAFPLYTDCMPAIVKTFIESLEPLCGKKGNPDIGFIVQSGFPEAIHSRYVERYLEKLAARLGCRYKGTVIKGGVEGIQAKPARMTRKLFESFYQLGKTFGETGKFDEQIVRKLAKPEKLSRFDLWILKLLDKVGLANSYWNTMLKGNNAFEKRFDKPYII
ncbi:MAG: NAD(P)H-dependent oxidoreductase [Caldisericaceae bacterium]|nr:NAD(P)H-dependent oxidoreductase [Caldisericaceae bacterium]